jgi:hypothetical protein
MPISPILSTISLIALELAPDLSNGMILSLMKNILPDTPETKVSMVLAGPKPRLVKLAISPHGEEPFSLVDSPRNALHYEVRIELGGVAGLVAQLIGKEPPEIRSGSLAEKLLHSSEKKVRSIRVAPYGISS